MAIVESYHIIAIFKVPFQECGIKIKQAKTPFKNLMYRDQLLRFEIQSDDMRERSWSSLIDCLLRNWEKKSDKHKASRMWQGGISNIHLEWRKQESSYKWLTLILWNSLIYATLKQEKWCHKPSQIL